MPEARRIGAPVRPLEAPVAAILFDLDGTLIDTRALYMECYRIAVEPYLGRGMSREEIQRMKPRSEIAFLRAVAGEAALEACMADFYVHYERLYASHFGGVYDGVQAVLGELRERGYPLGIVTGKSRRSWAATLAREELGDFDVLVFEDDVRDPKPHPEGIHAAAEALGLGAHATLYVGDTMGDVQAAVEAGAAMAAVAWSRPRAEAASFAERSRAAGAVAVLDDIRELLELVGEPVGLP
ncbi:MAG TPA: HAD-IA family hydrolase [Longimicrobiales bacterium]|nr:HAD-IA family hydrolase [Longimicrobiales bacterium]